MQLMHRTRPVPWLVGVIMAVYAASGAIGDDAIQIRIVPGRLPATMPMRMGSRRGRPVIIMGAVERPGEYSLGPLGVPVSLLDYLEGLGLAKVDASRTSVRVISGVVTSDKAKDRATTRPGADALYMLDRLMAGELGDIQLYGGELVIVQEARKVGDECFVGGTGVRKPGAYAIKAGMRFLKDAIAVGRIEGDPAGFIVELMQESADASSITITQYHLMDVIQGSAGSVTIAAGDTIIVREGHPK